MRGWLLPLLMLPLLGMAQAEVNSAPESFICTFIPGEGSEDMGNGAAFTRLAPLQDEWQLSGQLNTPSPNYRYEFGPVTLDGNEAKVDLRLRAPEGMSLAVIGAVNLDAKLRLPGQPQQLRIVIDRQFHWGPQEILCPLLQPAP
jgi:hypothetical protein